MEFFGNGGKEFLRIGNFSIAMYAVCIMIGMAIGAVVALREGKKLGIDKDKFLDGVLMCVPLAIIGARLFYVIFEWDKIGFENIFRITDGGLAITGGIIVAVLFVIIYSYKREMNALKIFDIVVTGLLIGQIFGRWGNFFNQEAHGGATTYELLSKFLPDFIVNKMYINGVYYHPTFLYESLWNFLGLLLIFVLRRNFRKIQIGDFLGFYLIWYGFGRSVLIEPYRTDALMMGDIRINVLIPAFMVIGGIAYLVIKHKKYPQELYVTAIAQTEQENMSIAE
ncbi:MAG: prolipoprotein diacylglyceryl transferase [bacterium]